jgi:hypothetical protein
MLSTVIDGKFTHFSHRTRKNQELSIKYQEFGIPRYCRPPRPAPSVIASEAKQSTSSAPFPYTNPLFSIPVIPANTKSPAI